MIFIVLNDPGHECTECGEVHTFFTRTIEDNCEIPALFEEELMFKLLDEGDGRFMGGRAFPIPLMTEEELLQS